ncbi:hypothetical protein BDB00DRAFT_386624 [Zychaea mexicana]|uniref:uncharacterized protein n=1 Tax=Zychaea mexicana TaxID=64656 RepID=UPI0022FDB92F|nr:uncharacterized protein BDB00DRAFT_386624 [Zychaea mexicana]KAI9493145.1 hypothetical protein BDB00DRAFT_386624 [Zychaea mexicana]
MDTLPSELLLIILRFVDDVADKCQLAISSRRMHNLLCSNPGCWSPLDLSRHGDRITNAVLGSILRKRAIPIILPSVMSSSTATTSTVTGTIGKANIDDLGTIRQVNLSGCWCLTPEAINMVACSLPQLTKLQLDRYGSTPKVWPFEQRDHLYQMRPSHNLSSLAMDMFKVPHMSLTLSESTLHFVLGQCGRIETLSLRYQNLGINGCRAIGRLQHLRHLDISSCTITQPVLQILIRNAGHRLVSLKMLNIETTNLTLLSMQQHAKNLEQLHLSCQEPQVLVGIVRMLERLDKLQDFRLTQLRTGGNVDVIVEVLNSATLRRLDLSPKLDFHPRDPKTTTPGARLVSARASPPGNTAQRRRSPSPNGNMHPLKVVNSKSNSPSSSSSPVKKPLQLLQLPRTEHQLHLTDISLTTLCSFKGLVELRLCYPVVSTPALTNLFKCLPNLEILELRMEMRRAAICSSSSTGRCGQQKGEEKLWMEQDETSVDVLRGLLPDNVPRLRELSLYHSWISVATTRTICSFQHLRELTIYNCGKMTEREPELVRRWLLSLHRLRLLRVGRIGHIRCDLLDDIATASNPQPKRTSRPDGEFIFTRRPYSGQWKWTCIND